MGGGKGWERFKVGVVGKVLRRNKLDVVGFWGMCGF